MKIDRICAGAYPALPRNDDHVAVFTSAEMTDIVVIDGGSSVADCDYIDECQGDVAWFVHAFAAALQKALEPGRNQEDCVWLAIADVRAQFMHLAVGLNVPLHAWPIAAMTWLRISDHDGVTSATFYSLGDCKTLLYTAPTTCTDLDPFVNPQEAILQDWIATLKTQGIDDPVRRHERMLPMLRARRESQNTAPAPSVLCLQPNGPFQARTGSVTLSHDANVLVMTDGFYRLVDLYGLHTDVSLAEACIDFGLQSQLDKLRDYELTSAGNGANAVKSADDASAVLWTAT
jgi:hypothetical protein